MEELSYEELVATLGQETADIIQEQRDAAKGTGGSSLPFTFLQKVSDVLGNELGAFSEFVVGAEKSKQDDGSYAWTNTGTNLGKEFQFVVVNVCYYYKRYVEGAGKNGAGKTFTSNIFKSLGEISSAVDYNGNPLPATKEAKREAKWKLVRMNAGVVRKTAKDAWIPCIWEVDGTMLFGFNNVVDSAANGGLLGGVLNIKTSHAKKGATPFVIIDESSELKPLPKDFFTKDAAVISDITTKMKAYQESKKGSTPAPQAPEAESGTQEGGDQGGW